MEVRLTNINGLIGLGVIFHILIASQMTGHRESSHLRYTILKRGIHVNNCGKSDKIRYLSYMHTEIKLTKYLHLNDSFN